MKKLFVLIAVCLMAVTAANAQTYSKAIGIEGGWEGTGITFKQFTGSGNFMDYKLNVDFWHPGTFAAIGSATYDFNVPLGADFHFFYGIGAEAGFFSGKYGEYNYSGNLLAGVFGNLGLEYDFATVPFALSVDWNPGARLVVGHDLGFGFNFTGVCMGLKYTF